VAVVAVLVLFLVASVRSLHKTNSDKLDSSLEAELYFGTRHERDPELHRRAMEKQWGINEFGEREPIQERVAMGPSNDANSSGRKRFSHWVSRGDGHSMPANPSVRAAKVRRAAPLKNRGMMAATLAVQHAPYRVSVAAPPAIKSTIHAPVATTAVWSPPTMQAVPVSLASEQVADLSATKCALPSFHSVVAGPEVRLTLLVGSNQGYTVDCPSMNWHTASSQKSSEAIDFGVGSSEGRDRQVTAQVVNGVLYVSGSGKQDVIVTGRSLDNLEVTGDSVVTCSGISDPKFKVAASGHSTVEVRGQAANFQAELSGNSVLRGSDLIAAVCRAGVSGNSAMELGGEFAHLTLNAAGNSAFRASGHAGRLDLNGTAGSAVDCSGMEARVVAASAAAGSAMRVCATGSLTASAKQASKIQYSGQPRSIAVMPDVSSRIYF